MRKLFCTFLILVFTVNVAEAHTLLTDSYRIVRGGGWSVDIDLLNNYLEALGFVFQIPSEGTITDGTQFEFPGGYTLKFEQVGDDKFATVFDKNNKPIASLKIMRDGTAVVTMYARDFERVINFMGVDEVVISETDSKGTWQLSWKAQPEGRDESIILLHAPGEDAVKTIKSYCEQWHGISVIPTVILEDNAVMRIRQDEVDADVVDIDSVSLYQDEDGRYYTLLAFWDENNDTPEEYDGTPKFVIYQGRIVFDKIRKNPNPEGTLDRVIGMVKRGIIPWEATVVSEWKDYSHRGKWVHRGATIAAMFGTAGIISGLMGLDPTNLFLSGIVAGVTGYVVYRSLKPPMAYAARTLLSVFMNVERIRNLYPASEQFLTQGIQRKGGIWFRFSTRRFSAGDIAESAMSVYRTLKDPSLQEVASDKFYMALGFDTAKQELRMKEIYMSWLLSKMFPDYPVVTSYRNYLGLRELGWKWAEQQFWAQLITTGINRPLQYTDVGSFGAYAVPSDEPVFQGEEIVGNILAGQTGIEIFESRRNTFVDIRDGLIGELTSVEEQMAPWTEFPQIITRYFDPEYRRLQVKKRVLEEKIEKVLNPWISELETFIDIMNGEKPSIPAFDWIDKITDEGIKRELFGLLEELGIPKDITLFELFSRFPILTRKQAQSFIETGILVFKNGEVLDASVLLELHR